MHREISPRADLSCLWLLYRLFRRERPDIIHANTPKASLLAMTAGLLARVPHRLYTVTGLRYQSATGLMRLVLMTMERVTCLAATRVIPEGGGVLHALQTDHITRRPMRVIHYGNLNGRDTAHFSVEATDRMLERENSETQALAAGQPFDGRAYMRRRLGIGDADFVLIFIGRIVRDKGINELTACMRRLATTAPQVKLLLVGSFETALDPLVPGNEEYLRSASNVVYAGRQEDVRPWLRAADLLVFPSYREGFPNVPIEAGAMGVPAVVTDINGCNEIVRDGLSGRVILAPLDHSGHASRGCDMEEALYHTLLRLATRPEEVRRMGACARARVQERYEQRDVWRETLKMYDECIGISSND